MTAIACADSGWHTLAVSLDPAHNLGDVLATPLSDKPTEVISHLWGMEVDIEKITERSLEEMASRLKAFYRYMVAFNLEHYLDTLRYSPGIEEYATLEALRHIFQQRQEYEMLIFDTPPTALMLKVMSLPSISQIWLEKLSHLRHRILERRRAIEKIEGERHFEIGKEKIKVPSTKEKDPVIGELLSYSQEIHNLSETLKDASRSGVVIVMNAEKLPLLETERAIAVLRKFHLPIAGIVINRIFYLNPQLYPDEAKRREEEAIILMVKEKFPDIPLIKFPFLSSPPSGIEELREIWRYIKYD